MQNQGFHLTFLNHNGNDMGLTKKEKKTSRLRLWNMDLYSFQIIHPKT